MSQPYLLDEVTARSIFDRVIFPALFGDTTGNTDAPGRLPVTVLVGGQPGAGKSMVEARVRQQLGRQDAVLVDVDDLRAFHPHYARLARTDDRAAAAATQADVQRWHRLVVASALQFGVDLVVSTTLRDPGEAAAQIERHRGAGRQVEIVYVAVDEARSGLGVLQRYAADRADPHLGFGRYTPPDFQRAAYEGLPLTAERVDADRRAHRVYVFRRGGECLYANTADAGGWHEPAAARTVIEQERRRPWTAAEADGFDATVARLRPVLPTWLAPDLDAIVGAAAAYRPPAPGRGPSGARQAFPRPLGQITPAPAGPPTGEDPPASRRPGRSR